MGDSQSKLPNHSEANTLISLASDDAPTFFDFLTGGLILCWSALLLEYGRERFLRCNMEPQSMSHGVTEGLGTHQEENVKFVDTNPGFVFEEPNELDPLRDVALASDAKLDDFFQRPVRIASYQWLVNGPLFHEVFNPWALYFQNPRVINRIANYRLLRSKLHVKMTISGTGFHYGRLLASYNPLASDDDYTTRRSNIDQDKVGATQRPHFFLNPTTSEGGEMVLPFFYYENVVDIVESEWQKLGEMTLSSLGTLKHANGAVDLVTINVFAWAEDVKFAIPTSILPNTLVPQALDEYEGTISRVAGIVANVAGKMSQIPPISKFARATEIGARGVGMIASLFGYSRPADLEHCQYRPNTKGSFAVTNMKDDVHKLTVDQKQELTIDPRTAGLSDVDELGINYIASKETYLTNFAWQIGKANETLLFTSVVDPMIHRQNGDETHLTAPAFAALPFKYWRGSMNFRFQIVCSNYHKGRLKVVYDPDSALPTTEYNTNYTTIIDIADTKDFTMTVGWGQPTTYRERMDIDRNQVQQHGTTITGYSASLSEFSNGTISLYVVNELTVPNDTINNDIRINVFVSMGDDFEVAVPIGTDLQRVRFTNATNLMEPQGYSYLDYEPQGQTEEIAETKPVHDMSLDTMAKLTSVTDTTNHVHFGECIRSFRQLLKRYMIHEFPPVAGLINDVVVHEYVRHAMPFEPGYTANSSSMTNTVGLVEYAYGYMTLPKYISSAFGGWRGGVRYVWDFTRVNNVQERDKQTITVSVNNDDELQANLASVLNDVTNNIGRASQLELFSRVAGMNGISHQTSPVNPTINFEVPFYSERRFLPAKKRINFGTSDPNMPKFTVTRYGERGDDADSITSFVSTAEDFTCFFYLGPPVIYLEEFVPS